VIQKRVGFADFERLDLGGGGKLSPEPRLSFPLSAGAAL